MTRFHVQEPCLFAHFFVLVGSFGFGFAALVLVVFVRGTVGVVDGTVAGMVVDDGALEEGTVFQ